MKRLIRNRATDAYLMTDGQWGDFAAAELFPNIPAALVAWQERGMQGAVEIVLVMGDTPNELYDVALSLFANKAGTALDSPTQNLGQQQEKA